MGINGLGRKRVAERFDSVKDYLNEHLFPIKDSLEVFKKQERETAKKLEAAQNKVNLQQQKLEYAYIGLEKWRK